jgi:exopolyphosphatase
VTEIVDHHVDERHHVETCPPSKRNIAFDDDSQQALVASTCTLVVERFYSIVATSSSRNDHRKIPPTLAILLLGVILLDSINMSPQAGKGTPRDGTAIEQLLHNTDWKQILLPPEIVDLAPQVGDSSHNNSKVPDPTKFFDCLQSQKFSLDFWNGLTALQGIRLDYKSFPLPSSVASPSSVGISTILLNMETFWKKDNLLPTIAQVIHEKDLSILALMFTFMKEEEDCDDNDDRKGVKPRRQLAVASTSKHILQKLVDYLTLMDDTPNMNTNNYVNLELIKLEEEIAEEKVTVSNNNVVSLYVMKFDQGNSAASRKQVAPIIMGCWKE